MKKKQRIISVLTLAISFLVVNHVSALTYQNSTNVDFTINPTISMTLSGDLIIDNLTPGSSGDSNIITVNVSTNASHGYYLSATVGDSSSASSNHNTSLNHSDNSNYKFNSLSSNVSSLSGFSDNQWGYSYCNSTNDCTNASNWISGSQGSTSSGYNGLPLDNDDNGATGVTLVDTTSPLVDSSIKFKIGAKASNTQAAGTYTNTINFYSVSYVTPDAIMQDLNEAWCTTTPSLVQDSRDGTLYHIQRLADGNCWMLDNLAIDLTDPTVQANLTESTTNASNTTLGYLKNGGGSTDSSSPLYKYAKSGVSTDWSGGNSYSIPLINMNSKDTIPQGNDPMASEVLAGNWKVGGYYNYCAASAGSYCYGDGANAGTSSGDTVEDICPVGWRIPTGSSNGEYRILAEAISGVSGNLSGDNYFAYRGFLNLPLSGHFRDNSTGNQGESGSFWSSTRKDDENVYDLLLGTITARPSNYHYRYSGYSVRCILNKTMQHATRASLASAMPNVGDSTTLTDTRDGQKYTVAKLADGKYWMTTNLNIAGGTALSSTDTDVSNDYIANFTTSNNLTKSGNTIVLPESSTTGFLTNNYSYVYNTGNTTSDCVDPGCYSYYSWDATTLGSGRSISDDNTDAPYSICPKGWHLPTTYYGINSSNDYNALLIALGGSSAIQKYDDSTIPTGTTMYNTFTGLPYNYLLTGRYHYDSFSYGESVGYYWSATSYYDDTHARFFRIDSTNQSVDAAYASDRRLGFAIRCLYGC